MWNGISLQFADDQWYSAFCVCVLAICISSLKKRLYRLLAYFLIGAFIILLCSYECSIYYRHKFFVICMICKCFLPFSGMSLLSLWYLLKHSFKFWWRPVCFFSCFHLHLWCLCFEINSLMSPQCLTVHFTSVPFQSAVPSELPS